MKQYMCDSVITTPAASSWGHQSATHDDVDIVYK